MPRTALPRGVLLGEQAVPMGELLDRLLLVLCKGMVMMNVKKGISFVCIFICLISIIGFASNVKGQQPEGAIYINSDGSVSGTNMIQQDGNIYRLNGSIYNSPITVLCNNIVLDGGGFTLQGPGGYPTPAAINLSCTNVVVRNFTVTGWEVGILGSQNSNVITGNNVTNNERDIAVYANNYNITKNNLGAADYEVRIIGNNNIIFQNILVNYGFAFWITGSSGNIITTNNITSSNPLVFSTDFGGFSVYHNNFINLAGNTILIAIDNASATLFPWDNGYPSGGNYWSDYTSKYPNATEIDRSGIGNTPYLISTNPNVLDRYPLLSPVDISQSIVESPSPNPTPTPNPTSTPTQSPPPSVQSSSSPSPQPTKPMPLETIYAIAVGIIALLVIAIVVAHRKRKPNIPSKNS
jgi:hypothetical protein